MGTSSKKDTQKERDGFHGQPDNGESKRFYEGSLVKSNDLQFVAKFAIAGPDGEVPQPTVSDEELTEEVKEDFTEARDVDELRRRVGTVQDGASVSLNWEGSSDLGLSIIDSNGEELSFFNPEGLGGGNSTWRVTTLSPVPER